MLPVTHGERYTRMHIFFYTLVMFAVTLLPYSIGMSHLIYLTSSILLGFGFLYWAVKLLLARDASAPRKTFHYSIVYLMLLFLALMVDHYVPIDLTSHQASARHDNPMLLTPVTPSDTIIPTISR